jgi:hypothetical protein
MGGEVKYRPEHVEEEAKLVLGLPSGPDRATAERLVARAHESAPA